MNSAETINKGNFKLLANPMIVFGKKACDSCTKSDSETGIAIAGGYGFGKRFDVEAKASFFDGGKNFGADAEYWLVNTGPVNVSAIAGFHITDPEGPGKAKGPDLTLLASGTIADKLELYGGLDWSRNKFDDSNFKYSTLHLVPGIEYRIKPQLDLVSEFGIALNDDSNHYFSIGLAFYSKAR